MLEYLVNSHFKYEIAIGDDRSLDCLHPSIKETIATSDNIVPLVNGLYRAFTDRYKIIIKSPGIFPGLLKTLNIPHGQQRITSQTEFFFQNCKGTIIGITGTKGKSTTSSLIYTIFREAGRHVYLVGNIGNPAIPYLASHDNETFFIYELSSYQLNDTKLSPDTAVLLNLIPEHLDYHGTFDLYVQAKANIFRYQTQKKQLIANADCMNIRNLLARERKDSIFFSLTQRSHPKSTFFVKANTIVDGFHCTSPIPVIDTSEIPLFGDFNFYNVLAAVAVSRIYGIEVDVIKNAIRQFTPLEHRLEWVEIVKGITFINDSISTIPQTTIEALNTFGESIQTLIIGGHNRGVNYMPLAKKIVDSDITNLILFPETGLIIEKAIKEIFPGYKTKFMLFHTSDMQEAVKISFSYTEKGRYCVLSPASSSLGTFENFQERGYLFKKYINDYK